MNCWGEGEENVVFTLFKFFIVLNATLTGTASGELFFFLLSRQKTMPDEKKLCSALQRWLHHINPHWWFLKQTCIQATLPSDLRIFQQFIFYFLAQVELRQYRLLRFTSCNLIVSFWSNKFFPRQQNWLWCVKFLYVLWGCLCENIPVTSRLNHSRVTIKLGKL